MRCILALLVSLVLAGCTELPELNYSPVEMMDSANLQDDLKKLKGQFTASDVNKKELMYTVILLTNQRCDGFFEALDRLRTNTEFAQGRVAALQTAVPALLEAANKSSAVSNVAAALGFVSGTLSDVKQNYLFAEFRQQLVVIGQLRQTELRHAALLGAEQLAAARLLRSG